MKIHVKLIGSPEKSIEVIYNTVESPNIVRFLFDHVIKVQTFK
jgi:hypothetical protein